MKVIIPVAGKGTRMRPFTHTRAKPLLPVAGKPVIEHILDSVLPLKPSEIVFITGHMKHTFEDYIHEHYPKLKVSFKEQKQQLGTADAIWQGKHAFSEDVLIIFSDTIFDTDLSVIKKCKDDGIIWAVKVDDPSRFGVIVTDKNNHMTKIVEKPKEFVSNLANIGLYYIKDTKLLAKGIEESYKAAKKSGGEVWLTEAFAYMVKNGAKIRVDPVKGWYDTGTQEETLNTNQRLLKISAKAPKAQKGVNIIAPVAIDPSAKITNSTIGPYVTIAKNVTITDSTVSDAIIDAQSTVEKSKLSHSIIGSHVNVHNATGSFFLGDHSTVRSGSQVRRRQG